MFGRDLVEQIKADGGDVPTIVSKCILAVEDNGMEYEGEFLPPVISFRGTRTDLRHDQASTENPGGPLNRNISLSCLNEPTTTLSTLVIKTSELACFSFFGRGSIRFITLFFRGARFNDISSITSVLKNYFRGLPDPLLTFELHEHFVAASSMNFFSPFSKPILLFSLNPFFVHFFSSVLRDPIAKRDQLHRLVHQLPKPYFETLKYLMLHLNR